MHKFFKLSIAVGAVVLGMAGQVQPVSASAQGRPARYSKYVTVTKKGYNLWSSFSFRHRKTTTTKLYHQTVKAKLRYHYRQRTYYLSLYTVRGRWLGYVNAGAVKVGSGSQGGAIAASHYVALSNRGYKVWNNFGFHSVRHYATNYYQHVYRVKAMYHAASGSWYGSLYDHTGRWFGYINLSGTKTTGAQGNGVAINEYAQITASRYTQWRSFSFKSGYTMSGTSNHPLFQVKRVYYHYNGSRYYSLYTPAGWAGYVNAGSTKLVTKAGYSAQAKYFATVDNTKSKL